MPIGFIGLGVMGQPMALNLVRSGAPVLVWNRTQSRCEPLVAEGAIVAASADALFAACQTIIIMLANEAATDTVLGRGTDEFAKRVAGKRIIAMGTNSPDWSKSLGEALEAEGAEYVEAPVSGSRAPASEGRLVAMIAASDPRTRKSVADLIAPMCRQTFDAGPVPSALRLKLSVNLYLITMVSGLAEAAGLARRLDLSWPLLQSVLDAGPMASEVSRMKLAKLAAGDFAVQASIRDVRMNCQLVADAAQGASFEAPLLTHSLVQFERAMRAGLGDLDMIGVIGVAEDTGSVARNVVADQLDAYNHRDLNRFMACWHDNATISTYDGQLTLDGSEAIREHHRRRFEDAALKAVLLGRTVVGNIVVDHEWVSRSSANGLQHFEVLASYMVSGGRIARASFHQVECGPRNS